MIATLSPDFISKETSFNVSLSSLYEKFRFWIEISIYSELLFSSSVPFFSHFKSNILFILLIAALALA